MMQTVYLMEARDGAGTGEIKQIYNMLPNCVLTHAHTWFGNPGAAASHYAPPVFSQLLFAGLPGSDWIGSYGGHLTPVFRSCTMAIRSSSRVLAEAAIHWFWR